MAQEGQVFESSCLLLPGANTIADLSAKQYYAVKHNATQTRLGPVVALPTGATDTCIGILQDTPLGTSTVPASCKVAVSGFAKAVAGAAITAGALVQGDNGGKVITLAATGKVIGWAVTQAAVDGELITIFLTGMGSIKA